MGSFVIAPGGPASNPAVNLLSNLGPVLLLIGLGFLGFRAWAECAPAKLDYPLYAIDDDTAIKVVDGRVEVVSEGE